MSKTLVLHYSKYGTTKKYAEWIAAELSGDVYAIADFNKNSLANYDIIVIGSGLYAGKIWGLDLIVNNYELLRGKKLVLFTCGLADYSKEEHRNTIAKRIEAKIPPNIMKDIKVFFLRGGIDYGKMSLKHRIMMAGMNMVLVRKVKKEGDNASDEDRGFVETYGKTADFTDKNSTMGIVAYCKGGS